MNKLIPLALAALLALPACLTAEPTHDDLAAAEAALRNGGDEPPGDPGGDESERDNPYEPDPNCHVPSEGIIDGTRNGVWCCGVALCTDEVGCGADYGKYTPVCADCHYYECIPGEPSAPTEPPNHIPPGGGVYTP
jgi:hypothetical protein